MDPGVCGFLKGKGKKGRPIWLHRQGPLVWLEASRRPGPLASGAGNSGSLGGTPAIYTRAETGMSHRGETWPRYRTSWKRSGAELATPGENSRHAIRVLGSNIGEKHGRSTLTNLDVREICRLRKEGRLSFQEIANRFGVDPSTVPRIRQHQT